MDWQQLLDMVYAFFKDPRVATLVGLVLLDVVFGIAAAVRVGTFDWRKLANFYQTMILPYVLGYLGLFLCAKIISAELLGPAGYLVGEGTITLAWLALVGTLVKSIVDNAKVLGYEFTD